MHPMIRKFPSDYFYDGNLIDSPSVTERTQEKSLELLSKELHVKPTMMFNLIYGQETENYKSKTNADEANFIKNLLLALASV